jgi:hypothetical protein
MVVVMVFLSQIALRFCGLMEVILPLLELVPVMLNSSGSEVITAPVMPHRLYLLFVKIALLYQTKPIPPQIQSNYVVTLLLVILLHHNLVLALNQP